MRKIEYQITVNNRNKFGLYHCKNAIIFCVLFNGFIYFRLALVVVLIICLFVSNIFQDVSTTVTEPILLKVYLTIQRERTKQTLDLKIKKRLNKNKNAIRG